MGVAALPFDPCLLVQGGRLQTAVDDDAATSCPCGCGARLASYNGVRPLVCWSVWKIAAPEDQAAVMNFGVTDAARAEASGRILSIAAAIKASRFEHPMGAAR